ncbi:hypothetical protein MsAg5_05440 [Methanosarcinaceae archaeon Ag5]|uniref:Phospholipase D-like domain-containing protein n=1 Tax=Methanolapillus africanus TaxID=3028297 RepID=A0AAE4SDF2_9EURY|nr:hypothetical protein [Methanosarcinaceae archaeon Ag5]
MARILDTQNCSAEISNLLNGAEKEIIFVTPYLKISPSFQGHFVFAGSKNISMTIIYRDDNPAEKELERLNEEKKLLKNSNVKLRKTKNLHAKCYMNESAAILTSMNLYQFSQENNYELGILVKKGEDEELYNQIRQEIQKIYSLSQPDEYSTPKKVTIEKKAPAKAAPPEKSEGGFFSFITKILSPDTRYYCIRCRQKISETDGHSLCGNCYREWSRYKNSNYTEKYCLICGEKANTTYNRPLCDECFKTQRYGYNF